MRIAHVVTHYWPCVGGKEDFAFNLCNALKERGHSVRVICLNKCAEGKELKEKENVQGVEVERVAFTDLKYYKIAPRAFEKAKEFKPQIVHIHGVGYFLDNFASKKKELNAALVLSTHGGIFHTKKLGFAKKAYFNTVAKESLKKFEAVVASSKSDLEIFKPVCSNIELIENGVNAEKFFSGALGDRNCIAYFGRIAKHKNLDNILNAIAIAKKKNPQIKFLVVGKDFDGTEQELKKLVKERNLEKNVFLLGQKSDAELKEILKECAFYASASGFEGFGISAIEAMGAAKIPLLSSIPSFKEFVQDGKNGFFVEFGQPEKAAEQILRITGMQEKELKKIAQNARESVQKFSWKNKVLEWEKLYESVLK